MILWLGLALLFDGLVALIVPTSKPGVATCRRVPGA